MQFATTLFLAIGAWGLASGCTTPAYRMPAGFSSSYHRYMQQSEPIMTDAVPSSATPIESLAGPADAAVTGPLRDAAR